MVVNKLIAPVARLFQLLNTTLLLQEGLICTYQILEKPLTWREMKKTRLIVVPQLTHTKKGLAAAVSVTIGRERFSSRPMTARSGNTPACPPAHAPTAKAGIPLFLVPVQPQK